MRTVAILEHLASVRVTAVIPSNSDRNQPRTLDRPTYAARIHVERFSGKIKEFRRVATRQCRRILHRCDMRARNFLATVTLAATRHLIRGLANATF